MKNSTESETLFSIFVRCSHLVGRGHHHRGGGHHGQGRILSTLGESGTMSQKELMELHQIRSASLSELLGKLEASGYVTRDKDEEDKRSVNITITEKGKSVAAEHEQWRQEAATKLFAPLTTEEQTELSGLLLKLLTAWKEERTAADLEQHVHHHHYHRGHHAGHHRGHADGKHRNSRHRGPLMDTEL